MRSMEKEKGYGPASERDNAQVGIGSIGQGGKTARRREW